MAFFFDPTSKESIMIEPLADKPRDRTLDQWLDDVKATTVVDAIVSQERIFLNGTRALKVINRHTKNVYLVHGSKTFAIRLDPAASPVLQRMLSTFKFRSH